ncbi:hypothetical protein TcWFU_006124 [Taenia crassiceps]|uniref:Uncharacterized protein n=1 Tax=Taenia crassiceps TaxID=6207 RepID=A0ABR4Q1C0_9CEST
MRCVVDSIGVIENTEIEVNGRAIAMPIEATQTGSTHLGNGVLSPNGIATHLWSLINGPFLYLLYPRHDPTSNVLPKCLLRQYASMLASECDVESHPGGMASGSDTYTRGRKAAGQFNPFAIALQSIGHLCRSPSPPYSLAAVVITIL